MTATQKLKKLDWPEGAYRWTGPINDLRPGRRRVLSLELRNTSGNLAALHAFDDLQELSLDARPGVDLSPLTSVRMGGLSLRAVGCDLTPIGAIPGLTGLGLSFSGDITVPKRWQLPDSLRELTVFSEGDPPQPAQKILDAVDWTRLTALESLTIIGDANEPIHLDWGLLRHLPNLTRLEAKRGAWHTGTDPSPLEPPFDGLSRKLSWIRIDAWDPVTVRSALSAYLDRPTDADWGPAVYQRYAPEKRLPPWTPQGGEDGWGVYGSLHDTSPDDFETEYDASDHAEQRLRAADPELAERILFDPENAGTGINAASRADLERALAILGLGDRRD